MTHRLRLSEHLAEISCGQHRRVCIVLAYWVVHLCNEMFPVLHIEKARWKQCRQRPLTLTCKRRSARRFRQSNAQDSGRTLQKQFMCPNFDSHDSSFPQRSILGSVLIVRLLTLLKAWSRSCSACRKHLGMLGHQPRRFGTDCKYAWAYDGSNCHSMQRLCPGMCLQKPRSEDAARTALKKRWEGANAQKSAPDSLLL